MFKGLLGLGFLNWILGLSVCSLVEDGGGDSTTALLKEVGLEREEIETGEEGEESEEGEEGEEEPEKKGKEEESEEEKEDEEDEEEEPEENSKKSGKVTVITDEEFIKDLPKDAKGLYGALKEERAKRQKAQAKAEKLEISLKASSLKKSKEEDDLDYGDEQYNKDIFKAIDGLEEDDVVSVKQIKSIIKDTIEATNKKNQALTKKNTDKQTDHQKKFESMQSQAEKLDLEFMAAHEDYGEIFEIFNEAIKVDEFKGLREGLDREFAKLYHGQDGNPSEYIYKVGKKLKPLFKKEEKKEEKKDKPGDDDPDKTQRIARHAKKKKTSAGSSSESRASSHEDLEALEGDELIIALDKLSEAEYAKVPKHIRMKVAGG